MNCWLSITRDCTRPCNCSNQHPLTLNSNPGIEDGDTVIITEESGVPCCIATVRGVTTSYTGYGELRIYVYLRDCRDPGLLIDKLKGIITRIAKIMNLTEVFIKIDPEVCIVRGVEQGVGGPGGI